MNVAIGPRARLALKIAGYALVAIITFVYAIHLTFPYERVRDKLVEQLSAKYDVTISGVERSWVPGRFALTGVTLTSRPAVAGQPPTIMYFKRVELDLKILPLLGKRVVGELDISTGSGSITGSVELEGKTTAANFKIKHVPMTTLPGISDAVGLPMDGFADGKLALRLPGGDWTKATGKLDLSCSGNCAVGDGVTKIYPKPMRPSDAAMFASGITVPRIPIDRVALGIDMGKGTASMRSFELVSPSGKVEVDFDIRLAKKIGTSTINGCIRYQCLPEFQRTNPGLCIGSPIVDEQGMLNIKLSGNVSRIRRLPQRCDTHSGGDDSAGGAPSRPTLDAVPDAVQPETPPMPVPPTPVTPTPTPMPPPPDPPPLDRKPMLDDVNGSTVPPPMPVPTTAPEGASSYNPGSTGTVPSPDTRAPYLGGSGTYTPGGGSPGGGSPGGGGTYTPGGSTGTEKPESDR